MAVGLEAASLAGLRGVPPLSSSMSRSEHGQASGKPGRAGSLQDCSWGPCRDPGTPFPQYHPPPFPATYHGYWLSPLANPAGLSDLTTLELSQPAHLLAHDRSEREEYNSWSFLGTPQ